MPWYRQGTVAVTNGQTTVTGTGTSFAANGRVGDAFQGPDGQWYEVTNIASPTVMSILPAYLGVTAASGSYGLAPMQGYVKESADRLRQLVEQFGSTLALLGNPTDVAALRANIGAAARGANSDITSITGLTTALSIAQGGTGAKTAAAARTALGLKTAAVADIVGTVSQAGGVPTGAIIERGSNANGEYTRYADGTQECWFMASDTTAINAALGSGFRSGGFIWTFPIAFSALPRCIATPFLTSCTGAAINASSAASCAYVYTAPAVQASSSMSVYLFAKGRWF
ncbi:phage tail protein [Pseudomonas mosselii]|uniref:phage tail protein n=1 Tax=Pseudomonas mosselii TaxID=78327 RepID=UPI0018D92A83|nr:phage tail protein [Pseudomonas mosselii]MBH3308946.1 phage tail protein [Pseudomonas mosselii]MBH3323971.1 phage tail protein [Pseudomonas mosselii]MCU9528718.1 phage tail protein [Pseudomonas mosselii]MCU9536053.1 phage tail protein [Pseudomonas mosselii]MCU9541688.1 phage tail protein [Pseudomonas mosselii]